MPEDNFSHEEKNKSMALVSSILFVAAFIILVYIFFTQFILNTSLPDLREGHKDEGYCQMVKLYLDTNGKEGWRDYRGIYYKDCLK
ncbi:MAG: hypothetical protein GX029_00755 [Pseudomonadaceae bacterium]|nr:hypothetical protein [Pseudomonadaceae bacterium]